MPPGPQPPEAPDLAPVLAGWLRRRRAPVLAAWGAAVPVPGATASGSTRLILGIAGRNPMLLPRGATVGEAVLQAGGALVVDRAAWNICLHRCAKTFLTLDLKPHWLRLYLRRHPGPRRDPCLAWTRLLPGPPAPELRGAADAAEALAREAPALAARAVELAVACVLRRLALEPAAQDRRWEALRDWAEEHLDRPLGRDEAARALGVHPGHVSRILARSAGCGFAAWINACRLDRACALLAASPLPVQEVARRCGFSSPGYFIHAFRLRHGTSPGRWRAARGGGCVSRPGAVPVAPQDPEPAAGI